MSPSTQQPPGKRTNAGFNPASISARSGRKPFGRFFQVCLGKSDTMSSQNVPGWLALMTSRALGSVALAFNESRYCFQSVVRERIIFCA